MNKVSRSENKKAGQSLLIVICSLLIGFFCSGCSQSERTWKPGIPIAKEKIKIAVIYPNNINMNSYYDNAHNEGILEMQQKIGLEDSQIVRKENVFDGDSGVVEGVMRDCIAEGANIIFSTTFGYMDVCEKLAAEFPLVIFIQTLGTKHNNYNFANISTKLYQARYLSGIVAGLRTRTRKIGYVAALGKDSSEVTSGINAFAIGVEEVNPEARIYVKVTYSWFDAMGETDAANALIAAGCDVIAAHCNTAQPQTTAEKAGVWSIGFNTDMSTIAPDSVISSVVPNWGIIYTRLVESIINGSFKPAAYFLGLTEGAIDITPLKRELAPPGASEAVFAARQRILSGGFNVFDGVLETNDGRILGEAGKTLPDDVILGGIDWYYRTVLEF